MNLLKFILGILGALLIIGAFSSFLPLFLLGGLVTGSVAIAFGLPIFLIIVGAVMVYFGFYYKGSTHNSNYQLIQIVKWGAIYTISILLGNYIINKLMIVNDLFIILITAVIISIAVQIVKSHESHFQTNWFIFYFLVYANVIWIMGEFILPEIAFQTGIFSSIVMGFSLAGIVLIIRKIRIKKNAIPWICFILVIILLVANLESLPISPDAFRISSNTSLSEDKQKCPIAISDPTPIKKETQFDANIVSPLLNKVINDSVWRIEQDFRNCYKGRYKNQYPDRYYCDDLVVSRWELSSQGTIEYRWYTVASAEWKPQRLTSFSTQYVFNRFICENGKKMIVDKVKPEIFTYDTKDGSTVNIHVTREKTETKIKY